MYTIYLENKILIGKHYIKLPKVDQVHLDNNYVRVFYIIFILQYMTFFHPNLSQVQFKKKKTNLLFKNFKRNN